MNITVIGASAGIGLETVKRALSRQHTVTTLSRSAVAITSPNLTTILGDALQEQDLVRALHNAEAVVVALGTRKNMKATTLFSNFAKLLVKVHTANAMDIPVLIVTGFGAGDSKQYTSWLVKLFLDYMLKEVYSDKTIMEEIIAQSTMKWIIVRPGRLLDRPLTEQYRIEKELYKGINIGGINRSDVADYLIKQCENPTDLNTYIGISNQ